MRYIGGKHRQGKVIREFVKRLYAPGEFYIEPFCGALNSACYMSEFVGSMFLSDIQRPLIKLWQWLIHENGQLPDVVTEEMYQEYKRMNNPEDPLTAYIGYGFSFGGKLWGGYARHFKGQRPEGYQEKESEKLKASTMKKVETMKKVKCLNFNCCGYEEYSGIYDAFFYLDPPYINGTKQNSKLQFDHNSFWEFARKLSKENKVLITEMVAPDDFTPIYNFGDTVVRHNMARKDLVGSKQEKIYVYKDGKINPEELNEQKA